jgi:hypothetical protein
MHWTRHIEEPGPPAGRQIGALDLAPEPLVSDNCPSYSTSLRGARGLFVSLGCCDRFADRAPVERHCRFRLADKPQWTGIPYDHPAQAHWFVQPDLRHKANTTGLMVTAIAVSRLSRHTTFQRSRAMSASTANGPVGSARMTRPGHAAIGVVFWRRFRRAGLRTCTYG